MSTTRNFFDWAKRQTLVALFSNPLFRDLLVLKGGNLLDIAFNVSTRSSVDLDFSIEGEFTVCWFSLRLLSQISQHREDHRPDFAAVQATVQSDVQLEGFDFYVDYVVRECRALETLWDE
jgi:predicted nucleotidyltransferase component of viral defense system